MSEWRADDVCPRPEYVKPTSTVPHAPALYPTSVWQCASPDEADALLAGDQDGYVYQRDRHPNADMLIDKCRSLHAAEHAAITASGMSALALALVSQTRPGDRVLVSRQVYGKTLQLMAAEARRWGVEAEMFEPTDEGSVADAFARPARLVVVETISNPKLRVVDLARLAELTHAGEGRLLVDNTFATPILCRPLTLGADLVMESVSKMMNGHSDVMLGLLCGTSGTWRDVPRLQSAWGLSASPFDCWLALRGIASLHLRMERACENALAVARCLDSQPAVQSVDYPGLPQHPDHQLAQRQLENRFGSIVTFELRGGRAAASRLITAVRHAIPFCPSLGEISTTLSHPESTSHRGLSEAERAGLGVTGGTIRLSCGIESAEHIQRVLSEGLAACGPEQ